MSSSSVDRDVEHDAANPYAQKKLKSTQHANGKQNKKTTKADKDDGDGFGATENDTDFRDIYDSLVNAAKEELIHSDETNKSEKILNLATLQRMILFHLQARIIKQTKVLVDRKFEERPLDHLQQELAKYAQAVRDWEQMAKSQSDARHNRSHDPFRISSKSALAEEAMDAVKLFGDSDDDSQADGAPQAAGAPQPTRANQPNQQLGDYPTATLETLVGTFRQRTRMNKDRNFIALVERFAVAMIGGLALIGPMLLMVLHKDTATDLSTTSVAVLLFSAFVAKFSSAPPEVILGVVAAYTAVLVVFVGTLQPNSP